MNVLDTKMMPRKMALPTTKMTAMTRATPDTPGRISKSVEAEEGKEGKEGAAQEDSQSVHEQAGWPWNNRDNSF